MLIVPRISIGAIAPDLVFLIVALMSIGRAPAQASVLGFIVGLIQDLFNPELLGLNALTKSVAGYGLSISGGKIDIESTPFLFLLFGAGALAHDFLYLIFFTGLEPLKFLVLLSTVSLPSAIYTALVGVMLHKVARSFGWKAVAPFGKARS